MPLAASMLPAQAAPFPRRGIAAARLAGAVLLAFLAAALAFPVAALDPELEIAQYGHRSWTARDGDFRGNVLGIGQSQDGYLWLGTGFGLLRFDGARFVTWQPPPGGAELPGLPIHSLLGSRDGSLWIGGDGLARWRDGVLTRYPELDGWHVQSIVEDRQGKIWVSGLGRPTGRLCSIGDQRVECWGEDGSLGSWVRALYEDDGGQLWVAAVGNIWRWRPGVPLPHKEPLITSTASAIGQAADGSLLVANGQNLRRMVNGALEEVDLGGGERVPSPTALLRDRDGGVWVGTSGSGLFHLAGGQVDRYLRGDGLSSDTIHQIFEDREGNVWVSTAYGLDQFRPLALPTLTTRQGLTNDNVSAVLAARDGGLWISTADGLDHLSPAGALERRDKDLENSSLLSLYEDRRGRIWVSTLIRGAGLLLFSEGRFRPFRLPLYNVFQMAEDAEGHMWFSAREQGLVRASFDGELLEDYSWESLGNRFALSIAPDARRGGIWLGFSRGGVGYFEKGALTELYEAPQGLGRGQVRDLQLSPSGALWAATQGGLSRIGPSPAGAAPAGGRRTVATLGSKNGLPCDGVHWMREDGERVWLYLACGLAWMARSELEAWEQDPARQVTMAGLLDQTDGVENVIYNGYYTPHVTRGADGRFFFTTTNGLAVLDPRKLYRNTSKPPVHVERILADGVDYGSGAAVRLPPRVRDLQIDYTAPSFVAPDEIQFRYRLAGYEEAWQEPGNRRQAFYRELPPGSYRFEVKACNDDGLWNEAGAALDLEVLPAYYQTGLFRLLALLAALGLAWLAYRWRVGLVTSRLAWQFEERLAERTRIANELHDTLLQGFISASMQLAIVFARLPPDMPEKKRLDQVLALMRRVVDEGRDAVRGLRSETGESDDLERAFGRVPGEVGIDREVVLQVAGAEMAPPLQALVRDEVYRIGREALVNALRHAQASRIAVEIAYRGDGFLLRIEDDGVGIDKATLAAGRAGHWGLAGLRERAARLGAKLAIASEPGGGTRVELLVPAGIAFDRPPGGRRGWLFRGWNGRTRFETGKPDNPAAR